MRGRVVEVEFGEGEVEEEEVEALVVGFEEGRGGGEDRVLEGCRGRRREMEGVGMRGRGRWGAKEGVGVRVGRRLLAH